MNRLIIMKGVLKTDNKRYRKSYSAQFSEEELAQRHAQQFLNESFGGSIKNLLICLTEGIKLSKEDVDELTAILHSNLSDKPENTDWIEIDSDSKANFPTDEDAFQYCNAYYLLENGAVIPEYTSNVMPFANCKHNYQSVLISTNTNTPCPHK